MPLGMMIEGKWTTDRINQILMIGSMKRQQRFAIA